MNAISNSFALTAHKTQGHILPRATILLDEQIV